jgi:hypothetical protein
MLITRRNYSHVLRQGLDAQDGVGEEFVTGRLVLQDLHQDVEAPVCQENISQQLSRSGICTRSEVFIAKKHPSLN